jgi:hypothetical protein
VLDILAELSALAGVLAVTVAAAMIAYASPVIALLLAIFVILCFIASKMHILKL